MVTPSSPGRDTSSTGFSVSPKDGASFISNETMMTNRSLKELLRMAMKKKWGSTVAAWRGLFDPHAKGHIRFGQFIIACEHVTFAGNTGNLKDLWYELTKDADGNVVFELTKDADGNAQTQCEFRDIDPDGQLFIDEARNVLVGMFGSLTKAWKLAIDPCRTDHVDEEEFLKNMKAAGVELKHSKGLPKLFKILLARRGQRSLVIDDLEALLIGSPIDQHLALWIGEQSAGGGQKPTTPKSPKSLGSKDFDDPASPRDLMMTRTLDFHTQDTVINSVDRFKKMLVVKFGSLFAAWRHFLDQDQNGVVTQKDFSHACVALGVRNVRTLWNELDENQNGQISLWEIDAELGDAFSAFQELLIAKWGSTKNGWRKVFDFKGSLRCEKPDFIQKCQEIGFTGDAAKLFDDLRPEPGRAYLTYEDVWINLNPNDFPPPPHKATTDTKSPLGKARPDAPDSPHPKSPKARLSVDDTEWNEPPTDKPESHEPPIDEPQTNVPPTEKPESYEPPIDEPKANAPPTDEPESYDPPVEEPETNAPPADEPDSNEPQSALVE